MSDAITRGVAVAPDQAPATRRSDRIGARQTRGHRSDEHVSSGDAWRASNRQLRSERGGRHHIRSRGKSAQRQVRIRQPSAPSTSARARNADVAATASYPPRPGVRTTWRDSASDDRDRAATCRTRAACSCRPPFLGELSGAASAPRGSGDERVRLADPTLTASWALAFRAFAAGLLPHRSDESRRAASSRRRIACKERAVRASRQRDALVRLSQ